MEAINITPKEIRKTMWTVAIIFSMMIFIWRFPDLLTAIAEFILTVKNN